MKLAFQGRTALQTGRAPSTCYYILSRRPTAAKIGAGLSSRLPSHLPGRLRRLSSLSEPSISFGPSEPPLLTQTIPEHFASVVARYADRTAIIARAPVSSATSAASPHETVYTYAALDRASDVLARGLRNEAGVRPGDRVAVSLGNGPEFAVLTYAVYKLGAVLVPLNPAFTVTQVAAALSHLGVRLLIMGAVTDLAYKPGRGRSNLSLLRELVDDGSGGGNRLERPEIQSARVPTLERIVLVDNSAHHAAVAEAGDFAQFEERMPALTPFEQLLGGGSILRPESMVLAADIAETPGPLQAAIVHRPGVMASDLVTAGGLSPSDVINIQFTSGTTAQPKAAMLSHRAILNNGALIAHQMGLRPTDRIVCPPPLFHCFGCVLGYMATATTGAALLLPSPAFDPAATLAMAADHRASGLHGVSTMFVAMLELLEGGHAHALPPGLSREAARALPEHLRTGITAGSSVPEVLMQRVFATLGLRDLVICYGMTETAPVSVMTTPADPLVKRTATCGRVMPHTAVKIVDPLHREQILPRGTAGEIAASGYSLMDGYWGEPAQTEEVLVRDAVDSDDTPGRQWMYTGDEGVMDPDGFVAVTGRIKDLIIRGGENIHPLEIENCLFGHPLVAEVSVVGVPDARHGEVVAAFVIPHGGVGVRGGVRVDAAAQEAGEAGGPVLSDEDVRTWVREHMSSHLVPKYVFWATDYPKTASGKIRKYKLREVAKELAAE